MQAVSGGIKRNEGTVGRRIKMISENEASKYVHKEWKKVENLRMHKALTIPVRSKLRKIKNELEKRIILVDILLDKPIKEDKNGTRRKGRNRKITSTNIEGRETKT